MNAGKLEDTPVSVRSRLSALWTALMFCYVYGDYFGLYRPGQLQGMLAGEGPIGPTSQTSLLMVSVLMIIPSLMTLLPLALPVAFSRWLNLAVSLLYAIVVAATLPGAWHFYLLFSCVEILLSLAIAWSAWYWPRLSPAPRAHRDGA